MAWQQARKHGKQLATLTSNKLAWQQASMTSWQQTRKPESSGKEAILGRLAIKLGSSQASREASSSEALQGKVWQGIELMTVNIGSEFTEFTKLLPRAARLRAQKARKRRRRQAREGATDKAEGSQQARNSVASYMRARRRSCPQASLIKNKCLRCSLEASCCARLEISN